VFPFEDMQPLSPMSGSVTITPLSRPNGAFVYIQANNQTGTYQHHNSLWEATLNKSDSDTKPAYIDVDAAKIIASAEFQFQNAPTATFIYSEVQEQITRLMTVANSQERIICIRCKSNTSLIPTLCLIHEERYNKQDPGTMLIDLFNGAHFPLHAFNQKEIITIGALKRLNTALELINLKGSHNPYESVKIRGLHPERGDTNITKILWTNFNCWLALYMYQDFTLCCSAWLYCLLTQPLTRVHTSTSLFDLSPPKQNRVKQIAAVIKKTIRRISLRRTPRIAPYDIEQQSNQTPITDLNLSSESRLNIQDLNTPFDCDASRINDDALSTRSIDDAEEQNEPIF
jgi:hypothetical protein